jgi:hypothetical protein
MNNNSQLSDRLRRSHFIFLICICICVSIVTLLQINAMITIYSDQGYETDRTMPPAVLTALAYDLAHGVFYRPLSGPEGYGGTRYMPLHFLLQAGLMKVGFSPMTSSWCLAIISLMALLASVYYVFSQLKVERVLALGSTLFVLLSFFTQHVFSSMRPDMLAAALNVMGIGLAIRFHKSSENQVFWGSAMLLCFVLAFFTKVSMIFGLMGTLLFFLFSGKRRRASFTVVGIISLTTVALLGVQLASEGQFFTSFQATGAANGGVKDIIRAPLNWLRHILISPADFLIVILAWSGLISGLVTLRKDILSLVLLCTSFIVVMLFGSPGVSYNHILDLYLIAVIYLTVRINNAELTVKPMLTYMGIAAFISTGQQANTLNDKIDKYANTTKLAAVQGILARNHVLTLKQDSRPILADNPWLPMLMGERPYVLDQFMLGVLNKKYPQNRQRFLNQIRQQYFRAVIIENPQVQLNAPDYAEAYMGLDLTKELLRYYRIAGNTGMGVVMVRKTNLQAPPKKY